MPMTPTVEPDPNDTGKPATIAELESLSQTFETQSGSCRVRWHAWGSGPVLLLLHGGAGSWTHWLRNIAPLALRYRVLVPDLPGMGDSDLPEAPSGARSIGAILAEGLETMLHGPARYDIVGFSFGGLIGTHLAASTPARVRSLTLAGTVGWAGLGFNRIDLVRVRTLPAGEQAQAHRANIGRLMIADPSRVDDTALWIHQSNARRLRLDSRGFYEQGKLAETFGSLSMMVNGIWGASDATVRPRVSELGQLLTRLRPAMAFRQIKGGGHWVQYEKPEAFNALLIELLQRTPNGLQQTGTRAPGISMNEGRNP
ncbi:alpha/beta fold hydrolase [Devosia sp. A369]